VTRHAVLLSLLAVLAGLLFLEPAGSWLIDPDESRYAEIGREMLAGGDYVTPCFNGAHYFEKPPLLYWGEAASFAVLGQSEFAARLPVRLATLATAAMLLLALGRREGPWAALFFLSAPLAFALGRTNLTDGLVSACLAGSFLSLRGFLLAREGGRRGRAWLVALGAATGLAVLAKGLIGVALPGLVLLAWAAISGRWRRVVEAIVSPAPLVFACVALPWFVLVECANPGFLDFFVVREHFERFATGEALRPGPFWYFLPVFAGGFLPWALLLPGAFHGRGLERWRRLRESPDDLLLALWVAVPLVFFSISRSKLAPYILPVFPGAAVLAARSLLRRPGAPRTWPLAAAAAWTLLAITGVAAGRASGVFDEFGALGPAAVAIAVVLAAGWTAGGLRRDPERSALVLAGGNAGLLLVGVLAFPMFAALRSTHDLAAVAAGERDSTVVAYGYFSGTLPWVLRRPVALVGERGELASDGIRPPEVFWSPAEFWRRWNSAERLVVLTDRRHRERFTRQDGARPLVLGEAGEYVLMANREGAGR